MTVVVADRAVDVLPFLDELGAAGVVCAVGPGAVGVAETGRVAWKRGIKMTF